MREVKEENAPKRGRVTGRQQEDDCLIGAATSLSAVAGDGVDEWEDIEDPDVAATKDRLGRWHTSYRNVNSLFRGRREPRGGRLVKAPVLPDDYRSFVRGDMYVGDFVNYQGIPLVTNDEDKFKGVTLEEDDRILYFQVDEADPQLTNKAIFETWLGQLEGQKQLPETLYFPATGVLPAAAGAASKESMIKEEPGSSGRPSDGPKKNRRRHEEDHSDSLLYSCDYFKPLGDEWSFTNNGRHCRHVGGDKFLGRIWVSKTSS